MEPSEKEKSALISGIEADARAEEQEIIRQAEEQVVEKRKYAEKKIESLLEDARKESQQQAEAAKKKIFSGLKLELKRRSMRIQDSIMQHVKEKVEEKLNTMISDTNYRDVIIGWITEAAIGLETDSAQINASEKERNLINDQLISEVVEKIQAQTGRKITLQLADANPLKRQGVVVTAADGRTAYNNQVTTRIQRKEREIRMLIYDKLFADDRKE
jgi:vacuolar-type H+-ATPase subunit E/Vma4